MGLWKILVISVTSAILAGGFSGAYLLLVRLRLRDRRLEAKDFRNARIAFVVTVCLFELALVYFALNAEKLATMLGDHLQS